MGCFLIHLQGFSWPLLGGASKLMSRNSALKASASSIQLHADYVYHMNVAAANLDGTIYELVPGYSDGSFSGHCRLV